MIWREGITFIVKKPNKPDYSKARAHRPIACVKTSGKVLEKVETTRLSHPAMTHQLLSPGQFGAVPGKSTVDAGLAVVHDIEIARARGLVSSCLTIDITGFFDHVNHTRLLCILREKKVATPVIKWVKCFLTDRSTALCLDGICDEMKPVNTGVPQGSSFSPLASNLYISGAEPMFKAKTAELIARYPGHKAVEPDLKAFVDDMHVIVSSDSLEINAKILQECYSILEDWAHQQGLKFDMDKRELIHFSRRPRDAGVSPSIRLPGKPDANGHRELTTLSALPVTKWLGIYWDRKLTFRAHVETMAAKGSKTVTALKLLATLSEGLV
jgi:hypothetical protein